MNNFQTDFTSEVNKDIRCFTNRVSKDDYYLNIAKEVSKRSTCLKRHYGAVIVKDDEIIATGYNGSPRGEKNCCDVGVCKRINVEHNSGNYGDCHSVHAEQNAMISASRNQMLGATLYLTGEEIQDGNIVEIKNAKPCPICERMIKNAGITRVVSRKIESNKELIKKAYRNKEYLTKDEYLYVICNFNPDSDSPLVLMSYIEQYNEYMQEISN